MSSVSIACWIDIVDVDNYAIELFSDLISTLGAYIPKDIKMKRIGLVEIVALKHAMENVIVDIYTVHVYTACIFE